MLKIGVILPLGKDDYLVNTVLDGLVSLVEHNNDIQLAFPDYFYPLPSTLARRRLNDDDFIQRARQSDLVILARDKDATNYRLAEKINAWDKTVFIDGSELGKNRRYDPAVQEAVANGTYEGWGSIDWLMLKKSALYFRREKPYIKGITPLPFGIVSRYIRYRPGTTKDIDFVCVFGQEKYPPLRHRVREYLEEFCRREGFSYRTKKTGFFIFNIYTKFAQRRFHKLLARAKVGISVGGGGFDTLRFWEILGNNCLLLTEKIDIFRPEDNAFPYKRIWEFSNFFAEFQNRLAEVGKFLQSSYPPPDLVREYAAILAKHSAKARVETILLEAKKRGIIRI